MDNCVCRVCACYIAFKRKLTWAFLLLCREIARNTPYAAICVYIFPHPLQVSWGIMSLFFNQDPLKHEIVAELPK